MACQFHALFRIRLCFWIQIIFILARSLLFYLFDFFCVDAVCIVFNLVGPVCVLLFRAFQRLLLSTQKKHNIKEKKKILHQMPQRPKIKQNSWIAVICDWSIYKYICRGMNFWRCIPTWNRISNRFYRIKQTIGWILSSLWVTLTCGMWHLTWDIFFRQLSRFQWDWICICACVCACVTIR